MNNTISTMRRASLASNDEAHHFKLLKITGASLIILGVFLNIPFAILAATFRYPQILREPTGEVLRLFQVGGAGLLFTWYAFALAALLLVFVALLVHCVVRRAHPNLANLAATFGVFAGILQWLGLIRWVFVVPVLAAAYTAPGASEATKSAAVMVFEGFHQYAGVALGEHLGQMFTALWIAFVSLIALRGTIFRRSQGVIGLGIAGAMIAGLSEGFATVLPFEPGILGAFTPLAFLAFSAWMIALGLTLWRSKSV